MAIAYKLLRMRSGKLYPLFVLSDQEIPIGVWLDAKEGVKLDSGKVKSKLGPLQFRPGWHLSDIPLAVHIGIKEWKSGMPVHSRSILMSLKEGCAMADLTYQVLPI